MDLEDSGWFNFKEIEKDIRGINDKTRANCYL